MAELVPYPFERLISRVFRELEQNQSIFDLPVRKFVRGVGKDVSVDFHGRRASTVLGPAAGPQSQLAQNVVLSFLGGGRIFELKTVQIMDELEQSFDFNGAAPFVGMEGEPTLRVDPRALREAYLRSLGAHNEQLERVTHGFGFDFHHVMTHDWLGPPLAAYLARRSAQIKRSKYG